MRVHVFLLFFISTSTLAIDCDRDLRKDPCKKSTNNYYVAFISRTSEGSGPGHAYVAWGIEDNELQMSKGDAYGFYPLKTKEKWSVIKSVFGEIRDDQFGTSGGTVNRHFCVAVDKEQYDETRSILKRWEDESLAGETQYSLLYNNCEDFVKKIASTVSLTTPNTFLTYPETFLNNLIDMNPPQRLASPCDLRFLWE